MQAYKKLRLLVLLCAFPLLAVGPSAQTQPIPPADADGEVSRENLRTAGEVEQAVEQDELSDEQMRELRDTVQQLLQVAAADVQPIDTSDASMIRVRLGQQEQTLQLYPYSMRSPDFQVLVPDETGALIQVEPPPTTTYRGWLADDPDAHVAASVIDGRLYATVHTGDGETWAIQPVRETIPAAPADLHVVYRASDVIGGEGTCGVDESFLIQQPVPGQPGVEGQGSETGGPAPRGSAGRTEIAFDADFEFFQANGNSVANTVQDIEMVMNQVGLIYQNQVSICYAITGIIVRTAEPDPYNATSAGGRLCEFRNFWNALVPIQRDVAHLMTGKNLDGSTIGIAWLGVICNVDRCGNMAGCNDCVNLANMGYGLSQSRFTTALVPRVGLTAHELGHNWSACHCDAISCVGGDIPDSDCGIMWSSTGPQQSSLLFGARSVTAITTHRDSRTCLDTCFDPVFVDWNNPLNGNGSFANPFRTVDEGVRYVPVGGQVIISVGTYPENITINKTMTVTATGGVVTVGQ